MPNVIPVLNEHIRKLARREARAQTMHAKRAASQYRRDLAMLKRLIKALAARVHYLERSGGGKGAVHAAGVDAVPENARFRKDGLKTHRAKMGISARDYGRLVGVSGLTIYNWEGGKSRPRQRQLAGIISVRGMGKREVEKRLAELDAK